MSNIQTDTPKATVRPIAPPFDIFESKDEILMFADLPGVAIDGVTIRLEKDQLLVRGQRVAAEAAGTLVHAESVLAPYERSFVLPRGMDTEALSAEIKDGVLKLRLPKAESVKPRQIPVTAA